MALARVKVWVAAEVLYAADQNAEFNNILNNALALVSPWTGNMAAGANILTGLGLGAVTSPALQFTSDANTGIYSSAADTVDVAAGGVCAASFGATALIAAAPEDARTTTVDVAATIRSTTSGTPAAGLGTGLQFDAESADENPSTLGRLDFVFTDVTAASEDSVLDILLRTAGAAEGARYRFQSTGAFLYTITGAPTAARTITLPDADATLGGAATQAEMEAAASTTVFASPGRTHYHPGVAKAWGEWDNAGTISASYNLTSITDTGVGDHTVTIGTDFSSGAWAGMVSGASGVAFVEIDTKAAGTARIRAWDVTTAGPSASDAGTWNFVGFGDHA